MVGDKLFQPLDAERDALLRQRDELASLSGSDEARLANIERALRETAAGEAAVVAAAEEARRIAGRTEAGSPAPGH